MIGSSFEVVLDHLLDVGVDHLVVRDAGARCVGQRDAAVAVDSISPGTPSIESLRNAFGIDEVVVDAAIDHVDPLEALRSSACRRSRRARPGRGLRPIRRPSAEPGTNARSRPSCNTPGVSTATVGDSIPSGARCSSNWNSRLGIVDHRPHVRGFEQPGKAAFHDEPVLQHVGHARRAAEVVLQHVDRAVFVADQIGAGDVAPDAARRIQADALLAKALGAFRIAAGTNPSLTICWSW